MEAQKTEDLTKLYDVDDYSLPTPPKTNNNLKSLILIGRSENDIELDEHNEFEDVFVKNNNEKDLKSSKNGMYLESINEVNADTGTATFLNALMNTLNSILGAGLIAIPLSFGYLGFIGVLIILPLTVLVMDFTMRLIVKNLILSQSKTYQQSVEFAMGNIGKLIILIGNGCFAIGGTISFLIIIGDSMPHVLSFLFPRFSSFFNRSFLILIIAWFICLPLALHRDIGKLGNYSMMACLSMVFIVFSVVIRGPFLKTEYRAESFKLSFKQYGFNVKDFVKGMSIINFAMICHHNTSMIFQSLKDKSKFNKLIHFSTIISGFVIFLIGILGYLIFQEKTKSNVLNNFPDDDFVINISRALFAFNMITTYPLEVFVLREVIKDLMHFSSSTVFELDDNYHFGITFVIVLVSSLTATRIENLGTVLELVGSYAGSLMAFILPPLVNIILVPTRSHTENAKHYLTISLGAFLIIYSTFELFT
ncbi:hypothetical protein QEN19_002908 [Hanseniaspora menglaensis]